MTRSAYPRASRLSARSERGTVLIVALVLAAVIGVSLVSYIKLSTTSLRLSQRSFFSESANHLVEAGLEDALYCFNQMGSGVAVDVAWTTAMWNKSGVTAKRTMPTFPLDQGSSAVVKIYVNGYDGSIPSPIVVAKATITPFEGRPIVKIIQITLRKNQGLFASGVVAKNKVEWNGHLIADRWVSNATNSPTGPWSAYPNLHQHDRRHDAQRPRQHPLRPVRTQFRDHGQRRRQRRWVLWRFCRRVGPLQRSHEFSLRRVARRPRHLRQGLEALGMARVAIGVRTRFNRILFQFLKGGTWEKTLRTMGESPDHHDDSFHRGFRLWLS